MVFITGGSQGLGESLSIMFASYGYDVLVGYYKSKRESFDLCCKLNEKYNVNCLSVYVNICDEKCIKNIFNKYDIDIVINNAALSNDNYIEEKTIDEFMDVVKTNLGGTYLVCKYAKKSKYIINIASRDGIDTYNPISLDYSSSKAGIINLSKNLSLYYNDCYIYCICPGWIDTDSVLKMNPNYLKEELLRIDQKKLLKKEYVAQKIFNLIGSNKESGSVIIINEKR